MKNHESQTLGGPNNRYETHRAAGGLPLICACGLALLMTGGMARAQLQFNASPEYYYWQEDYNGSKILDESGFRMGLELNYKQPCEHGVLYDCRIKFYFGSVDYNGALQNGTPLKTTTDYYGGLFEDRLGYRWGLGDKQFLDAMAGFGIDFWVRELGSQSGYNEYWLPIYFKAGFELCPREEGWVGSLGLKVPFYTTQWVDLSSFGAGTITLHPGVEPSGYAEFGYQFTKNISVVAFFDSYWFSQSSVNQGILQPESKTYSVGAKLGWTF